MTLAGGCCCCLLRVSDFSGFTVDTGKEVLKRAILAYHPDKQQVGSGSSRKWQVLAEEITKVRCDWSVTQRHLPT